MSNDITNKWQEIKTLIESIDLDVHKNAAGNVSAGVRARKGLRLLKKSKSDRILELIRRVFEKSGFLFVDKDSVEIVDGKMEG